MPDPDREIYPNAPLKLVAFEIQYAPIPRLESDLWEDVYEALKADFPILGPRPHLELELSPTGAREQARGRRLMNRERTNSASLFNSRASLETSAYARFEDWQSLIRRVVSTIADVAPIPSLQRLGLRYIDEIVIDGFQPDKVSPWDEYIADHLLQPSLKAPFSVSEFRAAMQFSIKDRQHVNFRFGSVSEPVVDPNGPLRISNSPAGPYFLIDLDSIWIAPTAEYPEFDLDEVMGLIEELHSPIRKVFESSITDGLRAVMRSRNDN